MFKAITRRRLLDPLEVFAYSLLRLIRTIAAASIVLLKNSKNLLPLNKPSTLAVIGELSSFSDRIGMK